MNTDSAFRDYFKVMSERFYMSTRNRRNVEFVKRNFCFEMDSGLALDPWSTRPNSSLVNPLVGPSRSPQWPLGGL
jgi:hypothetical protein